MEKEVKRLKADVRRLRRIVRTHEKSDYLVDRVVAVVNDAVESVPNITVPQFSDTEGRIDETVLLHVSDVHVGKKTKSYNPRVFKKRLTMLFENMMKVVTIQRSVRPLKDLVIVMNGDIIDAESVYPGQAVDGICVPVLDQIFSIGLPAFTSFMYGCLENFETVTLYCNRGNHGRQNAAKWSSSKSTNWDYVFYHALEAAVRSDRIEFHIPTLEWKSMFRIQGHGFLSCHGDMIRRYYSLPWYGMTRQAMRWQNAYQSKIKLSHFMFGHNHNSAMLRFNNVIIHCNGSFVSDDPYAEENLGVASVPEQTIMGVHPKYGVSWRYVLNLK